MRQIRNNQFRQMKDAVRLLTRTSPALKTLLEVRSRLVEAQSAMREQALLLQGGGSSSPSSTPHPLDVPNRFPLSSPSPEAAPADQSSTSTPMLGEHAKPLSPVKVCRADRSSTLTRVQKNTVLRGRTRDLGASRT